MQNARIIYAPGENVIAMLRRRMSPDARKLLEQSRFDAVGLVQTSLPNLFYYADIGQKAGHVTAVEILGNCPQHMGTLAFLGNTAAVNAAMQAVEKAQ